MLPVCNIKKTLGDKLITHIDNILKWKPQMLPTITTYIPIILTKILICQDDYQKYFLDDILFDVLLGLHTGGAKFLEDNSFTNENSMVY